MRPGDVTNSNERGMSLLEVLIALVILAFVALGIASLFHHAQFTNASGYSYAVLASEARRALEAIQSLPFNDAALNDTAGTPVQWQGTAEGFAIWYTVDDFGIDNWTSVCNFNGNVPGDPLDPASWPAPGATTSGETRLKRVTLRVSVVDRFGGAGAVPDLLMGRRQFVVSTLRIPD
jgi:prepilin-type N-terminal cleavage/methylation domain-containing protein